MQVQSFLDHLDGVRSAGDDQWTARCPAHDDRSASFSVGLGNGGRILLKCHAGCETPDILSALKLELQDLMPDDDRPRRDSRRTWPAVYEYVDADGRPVMRSYRTLSGKPKALPAHPCPEGALETKYHADDGWTLGLGGDRDKCRCPRVNDLVLYRLPEIRAGIEAGKTMFIVEGEPDVETLRGWGLTATTNPLGAGKWRDRFSEELHGADVVILPDLDAPGRKHAAMVAKSLRGKARSARVVELPDLTGAKGDKDLSDWERKGHTLDELQALLDVSAQAQTPKREGSGDHEVEDTASELDQVRLVVANLLDCIWRDPACAFEGDTVTALAALRRHAPSEWQRVREALKACGVRVVALDQLIDAAAKTATIEESDNAGERRVPQRDVLLALAEDADLWHSPGATAYADIRANGHRETWPVDSTGFRRWLGHRFYEDRGGAPTGEAVVAAISGLEARAYYDGPERQVVVRVGTDAGKLYIDLADSQWRAVEVDAGGWRVIAEPPVRFRRSPGMLALSEPTRGGSLDGLRSLLNVRSNEDYILLISWLLATLRDRGPYPVLELSGEAGSAKSTTARILRGLVDPAAPPHRSPPREDRDLVIAGSNSRVIAYDNLSAAPVWLSDALCRIATGGGFATRTLYTDCEETILDITRPIVLTGVEDVAVRDDLSDRAIHVVLQPIADADRLTEDELEIRYQAARPGVLGVLLDAVSHGLRELPHVRLERLPRMADFARWAVACGDGLLWRPGEFMAAYESNRRGAAAAAVESDHVAAAVVKLLETTKRWSGTAAELLAALSPLAGEAVIVDSKRWPQSPRAMSGRLRRVAPALRRTGVEVGWTRDGHKWTRRILLSRTAENGCKEPSAPSAPPATIHKSRNGAIPGADGLADGRRLADDLPSAPSAYRRHTVGSETTQRSGSPNGADDADGADGRMHPFSGPGRQRVLGETIPPAGGDPADDWEV